MVSTPASIGSSSLRLTPGDRFCRRKPHPVTKIAGSGRKCRGGRFSGTASFRPRRSFHVSGRTACPIHVDSDPAGSSASSASPIPGTCAVSPRPGKGRLELGHLVGLAQESLGPFGMVAGHHSGFVVAAGEDHRDVGPNGAHRRKGLPSAHAGHGEIQKQALDSVLVLAEYLHRLDAVACGHDLPAQLSRAWSWAILRIAGSSSTRSTRPRSPVGSGATACAFGDGRGCSAERGR